MDPNRPCQGFVYNTRLYRLICLEQRDDEFSQSEKMRKTKKI